MRNVASGLNGSAGFQKFIIHTRTVDNLPATCDLGENSGPQPINLKLVDSSGNVLVDDSKDIVCNGGSQKVTREIFIQTPDNCDSGDIPDQPHSVGIITATASAPGTGEYSEDITIRCNP